MVKRIVAKTKHDCEHLLGTYLDESHYDVLVEEDTDCYMPPLCGITEKASCGIDCEVCPKGNDELRIAFKFRKNYFSKEEQTAAYEGLRLAAGESQNRGMAAGPKGDFLGHENKQHRDWVTPYELEILNFLMDDRSKLFNDNSIEKIREKHLNQKDNSADDTRGQVWLRSKVLSVYSDYHGWFDKWVDSLSNKPIEMQREEAKNIAQNWISVTNYAKPVYSGVAGWYDRYPRIPYGRATSYTERNPELFAKSIPFLQSLNKGFKELLPWRWNNQNEACKKIDSRFLVPETVFTTITVNKTFRTAAHRDAGDLHEGLSNLLVVGSGDYTGGYLIFPEYRVAVNVRPGDLLLVNNHEIIHGNTPIVLNNPEAERISLVCYFREKMLELKSWEYEQLRRQFVDERRMNHTHPLWRPLWNGVSPGCFKSDEWRDFLIKHNWVDEDGHVDVTGKNSKSTLESFFS